MNAETEEMWHDEANAGPVARAVSAALTGAARRMRQNQGSSRFSPA
ncbi:hypothetical protein [Demequina sp.]|nr:hypothetical protein [Demequina sp.]